MRGISRVNLHIMALHWELDKLASIIALKKERAVSRGLEMREQDLADGMNGLINAVNAALEKEGRPCMKLTGRIELTEWENTEEKKNG